MVLFEPMTGRLSITAVAFANAMPQGARNTVGAAGDWHDMRFTTAGKALPDALATRADRRCCDGAALDVLAGNRCSAVTDDHERA